MLTLIQQFNSRQDRGEDFKHMPFPLKLNSVHPLSFIRLTFVLNYACPFLFVSVAVSLSYCPFLIEYVHVCSFTAETGYRLYIRSRLLIYTQRLASYNGYELSFLIPLWSTVRR